MLNQMLKTEDNDLLAIMDAGALFQGISHRKLADQILNQRPDLQGVIYFSDNKAWFLKREKTSIPSCIALRSICHMICFTHALLYMIRRTALVMISGNLRLPKRLKQ